MDMFSNVYEMFYYKIFCSGKEHPYEAFLQRKHTLYGDADFKELLEDYFKIDLTI